MKTYVCDTCGAHIDADPATEAKLNRYAAKSPQQGGAGTRQFEILCNPPCPGVLYRAVELPDGTRVQVIPACSEGYVDAEGKTHRGPAPVVKDAAK